MLRAYRARLLALLLVPLLTCACQGNSEPTSKPTVTIAAPANDSEYAVGDQVPVQSASADPQGIAKVELLADGKTVRTDRVSAPEGKPEFSLVQLWLATTAGSHTLTVRATNTQGAFTETDVQIQISESEVTPTLEALATELPLLTTPVPAVSTDTPEPLSPTQVPATAIPVDTEAPTEPPACVPNAQFVADVTIPDGTVLAPGAAFTKTWRVRNNGSCAWDDGYTIVFSSGADLAGITEDTVPLTEPGATADISIPMTAPNAAGSYKSTWRFRDADGKLFGTGLSVLISTTRPVTSTHTAVPATPIPASTHTPTAQACSGTPNEFTFEATATTINAGQAVTLSWGAITNASAALLDGEGIPSPGQREVKPKQTTTYSIVASCGNKSRTKQVTITVNGTVNAGDWFAGHWNIHNGTDADCTMDLTASGTNLSGTFCYDNQGTTTNGSLQGTASYPAAGALPVLAGNYTLPGFSTNLAKFTFYSVGDGDQFQGSYSLNGKTKEFCGWRDGAETPDPCKK